MFSCRMKQLVVQSCEWLHCYHLDAYPLNPTNSFKLKQWLFGTTNIVKYNDKEKWVYGGYEIAFDGANSESFRDDFTRNVVTFGVDNNSLSHTDNCKNNCLV